MAAGSWRAVPGLLTVAEFGRRSEARTFARAGWRRRRSLRYSIRWSASACDPAYGHCWQVLIWDPRVAK